VSIMQLKEWMGHADIDTTMKYPHFAPRAGDADLVAEAFATREFGEAGRPRGRPAPTPARVSTGSLR
jgi:hypothetical protein